MIDNPVLDLGGGLQVRFKPEARIQQINFVLGYWKAVSDFGIWKDGVQTIGCLDTPVKDAFIREFSKAEFIQEIHITRK